MSELVPDVAGEVVAFRLWVLERTWRLGAERIVSLNGEPWPERDWLVATCRKCASPPGRHCSCGIYAARSSAHLLRMKYPQGSLEHYGVVVVGEVGLAGRVIPGTDGYRAARARPIRLWLPHDSWEHAAGLRARYGVEVSVANLYEEVI